MPNGKGSLECSYCLHWQALDGDRGHFYAYQDGRCTLHNVGIPGSLPEWIHRVCTDFSPSDEFAADNHVGEFSPSRDVGEVVAWRLSWLGADIEPDTLYGFHYNDPSNRWVIKALPPARRNELKRT